MTHEYRRFVNPRGRLKPSAQIGRGELTSEYSVTWVRVRVKVRVRVRVPVRVRVRVGVRVGGRVGVRVRVPVRVGVRVRPLVRKQATRVPRKSYDRR